MAETLPNDDLDLETRRKRLVFRAWHRGVKEADIILGHFVRDHVAGWDQETLAWFERLLEESDRDILAWIMKSEPIPALFDTKLMRLMQKLDYVKIGD
ncbi:MULTISPECIES: succinate dehydrogenase assembly factor 2 [Iodidimonas]|jgi:antitoxin CptB|uniref:FAD assembly factor SdhE n=1 Tax=Iodidimonas nitroreducens TaxID=1236968 RepID=A0A5A7N8Z3_9PROT|nr:MULTISPECIES: succinate dehydrogenase assembly factor 2 [Iodidimonas]GAK32219.1 succinate dehydrogenase assembly factor 2-B, mitochondrial [alpha proteobacterium Q-1]GER04812.1 hypothetical protein JCM17846_24940 [Iodidimonas nitroreducens]